jgi:hypothetical protein
MPVFTDYLLTVKASPSAEYNKILQSRLLAAYTALTNSAGIVVPTTGSSVPKA